MVNFPTSHKIEHIKYDRLLNITLVTNLLNVVFISISLYMHIHPMDEIKLTSERTDIWISLVCITDRPYAIPCLL